MDIAKLICMGRSLTLGLGNILLISVFKMHISLRSIECHQEALFALGTAALSLLNLFLK